MEFSFKYHHLLEEVNQPMILLFVCMFGSILSVFPLALFRWILKKIGLRFIADWKMLDNLMVSLFICGFLSLIVIMPLIFVLDDQDPAAGIRIMLIWIVLFIATFVFCTTQKESISKWVGDVTGTDVLKKKQPAKKGKPSASESE